MIKISYAGNNGYNYSSIGKYLIKKSFLKKEGISAEKIKNWLRKTRINEMKYLVRIGDTYFLNLKNLTNHTQKALEVLS